jgi:hypothetical protein
MATLTHFSEYYKTISNSELLQILENPNDYQATAVEAAKHEFAARQLSKIEIKEAKEPLIAKRAKKEQQEQKVKIFEDKIKNTGNSLLDTISPVQIGIQTVEKSIRLVVIMFSGLFLYQVIRDYRLFSGYVQDFTRFPLLSALTLLPMVILPVAIFTFWKKRKIGWTLLTIFLTFSIVSILWTFYQSLSWRPSGLEGLDNLFPQPSPITYIIQLLFFVGTLFVICKKDLRDLFSTNNSKMQITIAITAVVSFFLTLAAS